MLRWRQQKAYTDTISIYRAAVRDHFGNLSGVLPVSGAQNIPAKLFTTSQYDQPNGPAGQNNQDNIMTADAIHVAFGTDVRARDFILIVDGPNEGEWYTASGEPLQRRGRANYMQVFLQTCPPPPIADTDV